MQLKIFEYDTAEKLEQSKDTLADKLLDKLAWRAHNKREHAR